MVRKSPKAQRLFSVYNNIFKVNKMLETNLRKVYIFCYNFEKPVPIDMYSGPTLQTLNLNNIFDVPMYF